MTHSARQNHFSFSYFLTDLFVCSGVVWKLGHGWNIDFCFPKDHPCHTNQAQLVCVKRVSGFGVWTGTNSPPHTFAAERSSSLSPCPPLRPIPPSWSDPAVCSSPFSLFPTFLWWGREGRAKMGKRFSLSFVPFFWVILNDMHRFYGHLMESSQEGSYY